MRRRKNVFASIDLGAEEIKLLIGQKGLSGWKPLVFETYSREELAGLSQRLEEYRPKEIIAILPQERVIVRDLTIPPVEQNRIQSVLYFELSGTLPYAMEQVELDYLLLERSKQGLQLKVFVIPEYLEREVGVLTAAGIMVSRVIPRGLAVTAYAQEHGFRSRLVKVTSNEGDLLVYPDYQHYYSRFYGTEVVDLPGLKSTLKEQGINPLSWDLAELKEPDVAAQGGILFYLQYPKFSLQRGGKQDTSGNLLRVGIGVTVTAILLVNVGSLYLGYVMKQGELKAYQERLSMITARTGEYEQYKSGLSVVKERYDKLAEVAGQEVDYLYWLKELNELLAYDTEVNILVLEKNLLREMHGKAPSATDVSERLADSMYFESPEFTSPITPKEDEDGVVREEFSLTAELTDPLKKGDEGL